MAPAVTDVVVAGAGPAGTAAGITLAALGRRVTIVDKAVFPRDKCCGDGLTAAALRRLEGLGLDPSTVASWQPVADVEVVSVSGRRFSLPLGSPSGGWLAASAARRDLDAALVGLARRRGVAVVEGVGVESVRPRDGGVEVGLGDGRRLDARYLLACDGMWSPVRRFLKLTPPGYLGDWQAGRQYLRHTGPLARRIWVWFEPDMIPGYVWSFPLPGDRVNFGYGMTRASRGRQPGPRGGGLRGQAIDWTERPHIAEVLGEGAEPDGPWRAWPIPARITDAALSALGGRVLFAGDAAGACDPMTGEGIAQALETAEAAARAVAQAGPDRPAAAAARYRRIIRWGLAVDDTLARRLGAVLARPGGSDGALGLVDRSAAARRHFARWMFEDYPRAVAATPHRWRAGLLSGPGAYAGRPVGPRPPEPATFAGHD